MLIRKKLFRIAVFISIVFVAFTSHAREREPLKEYAGRRAKLRAQLNAPVVLFAFTGQEDASPAYVFNQEENFYYLTGHNEPGAVLLLVPDKMGDKLVDGPKEIMFLRSRDLAQERWNAPVMGPDDPGVAEKIGIERVEPFASLPTQLERLGSMFRRFYTLLPAGNAGYPHAKNWNDWLRATQPRARLESVTPAIGALRMVKSESELVLLKRAIDLSAEAHVEAMKMMRPGLYEYEIASRMEYIHKRGGCETEGYAPIVGTGFNSTVLHYDAVRDKIQDGDIVVLDVAGQYSGYSADITRTLPANGKFTARQREIYEIVLAAANAAIAAIKPGVKMSELNTIAREYIDSHGKDREGKSLGKYFIHGLGHHIGLNVHEPGDPTRPLEANMVITIEPGIYIPDEKLGVRIEDDVLVTATGAKILSSIAPRTIEEVEKLLAGPRLKP